MNRKTTVRKSVPGEETPQKPGNIFNKFNVKFISKLLFKVTFDIWRCTKIGEVIDVETYVNWRFSRDELTSKNTRVVGARLQTYAVKSCRDKIVPVFRASPESINGFPKQPKFIFGAVRASVWRSADHDLVVGNVRL